MERHLRHKFAIELFMGRYGFPTTVSFLPNVDIVEAWKVCYCLQGKELDPWYLAELRKRSKMWHECECQVFHIPKAEHLLVNRS